MITLPDSVWRSVAGALADYIQFGPGNLDAEYIPDKDLEKALHVIRTHLDENDRVMAEMLASLKAE